MITARTGGATTRARAGAAPPRHTRTWRDCVQRRPDSVAGLDLAVLPYAFGTHAHGGQNALAEVAAARRPAVVVATQRPFNEQEHTRAALGIGGQGWGR